MLGDTLLYLGRPLASFMVVFGTVFIAFAAATFIVFGSSLRRFRNFLTTFETLLAMMLSKSFRYIGEVEKSYVYGYLLLESKR